MGWRLGGLVGFLALSGLAVAQDTFPDAPANHWAFDFQPVAGNPRNMSSKSPIRMESEKIKLSVGKKSTAVTCAFVFKNLGKKAKVDIAFPVSLDGRGAFQIFVDGNKGKSKVAMDIAREEGVKWHVLTVDFAKHQTRFVVDQFSVAGGIGSSGSQDKSKPSGSLSYALHTGAGWSGRIGKATVLAQFSKAVAPRSLKVHVLPRGGFPAYKNVNVLYQGYSIPKVSERNVLFVARKVRPSDKADIHLLMFFAGAKATREHGVRKGHKRRIRIRPRDMS